MDPEALGGRLPLLDRADLIPAQTVLWDEMNSSMASWATKMGFESKTPDGRFIGPFNPMLRSPAIASAFLRLQLDEASHTSLSERTRQVVILSVASVWKAPYALYAHAAAARAAGFSDATVETLAAGAPGPDLSAEEALARRLALALAAGHAVDDDLYAAALRRFGEKGLVDLAVLAGCYHLVCGLLNLFAVPAPIPPTARSDPMPSAPQVRLTVVAEFPEHFFLENLAVRADGSMLVTVANRKELWFVPTPGDVLPVAPIHLFTFEFNATFVVEWRPERFLLGIADVYDTHEARLYELDLSGWSPGAPVAPRRMLDFPQPWAGLNGACLVAPDVLLAAGMAGLIWRVDLGGDAGPSARVWLQHDSMKNRPGEKKPEQPGTNGVQFDRSAGHVYYTTTSQQMMLRVKIDPTTFDTVGLPEFVAGGREWDDFLIDEEAGVAYATTHRENTIDRVRLQPDGNREGRTAVAGDPFDETLVGPSAGAWGRVPGDRGSVAYFISDGGTAEPPDGRYRTAKVLRAELSPTA